MRPRRCSSTAPPAHPNVSLTVEVERDADGAVVEVHSVTGNNCPRGDKFAHQELTCPMRVLTTTVAVSGGDEALLPVRTAEAIRLRSTPKPWPSSEV